VKKFSVVAGLSGFILVAFVKSGMAGPLFASNYLPHRYCYLAQPGLVWTNVATDALIAASYALIFGCLMWVTMKLRSVASLRGFLWIFFAFGTFILACGATHAMEIVTVWLPVYPLSAAVKVICAAASVPTAVLFAWATPALVASMRRFFDMLATTQQEKEQAMRALVASEKLAAAGLVSATISHEIKGPLQSAGDLVYLLSEERQLPPEAAEQLALLNAELKRAFAIANNTLSLFGKSTVLEQLSLSALAENVLVLQKPELRRRGISVESRLATPLPLLAYSGELQQILINLIQNAAAAIGANGRILVRIRLRHSLYESGPSGRADSIAAFRPSRPPMGYSLTVADDGPGIELGHRARLFTLFFTTKGDKGTGLGLWLVRSMIEKLGGRIRVRSRTAAESSRPGTVFNIWIPLEPVQIAVGDGANLAHELVRGLELPSKA
jgi:signal transduction histidine kinase